MIKSARVQEMDQHIVNYYHTFPTGKQQKDCFWGVVWRMVIFAFVMISVFQVVVVVLGLVLFAVVAVPGTVSSPPCC